MFPPELKVKRFLDSLAYLYLIGDTENIETDYKKIMHAKREIPASSCPSFVENMLYANGSVSSQANKEEQMVFNVLIDRLDAQAEKYEAQKSQRKKYESLFHKKNRLGITGGEWCTVLTDGSFEYNGRRYRIDEQAAQYQPIETELGELYDMDRILAGANNGEEFFDMNYDVVKVYKI